jgi:hypothetical protein
MSPCFVAITLAGMLVSEKRARATCACFFIGCC